MANPSSLAPAKLRTLHISRQSLWRDFRVAYTHKASQAARLSAFLVSKPLLLVLAKCRMLHISGDSLQRKTHSLVPAKLGMLHIFWESYDKTRIPLNLRKRHIAGESL
jgi:hypothetical protein